MFYNRVSIAQKFAKSWRDRFPLLHVFADEEPSDPPENNPPQINVEQIIARVRKEEKDKLYPRLKKLEEDNVQLVRDSNTNLLKIAALQEELEKLQKNAKSAHTEEEFTTLTEQVKTLTAEIEKHKKAPTAEQIRKEIEAEYSLKDYLREQVNVNKGKILSPLVSEIQGKTKEEIDQSIASVLEKSATIRKELGLSEEATGEGGVETPPVTLPKPAPRPKASAPSSAGSFGGKLTAEQIRNLDPRSDEYKKFRASLGLK